MLARVVSRFLGFLVAACLSLSATGFLPAANAQAIIQTAFTSAEAQQPVDGTKIGLKANLPDSTWAWGSGWTWGAPKVTATWDTDANRLDLAEERTALGISIASKGSYTKPAQLRVIATLVLTDAGHAEGKDGVGFWAKMPASVPEIGKNAEGEPAHVAFGGDPFAGFTGLVVALDGSITIYENGTAAKSSSSAGPLAAGTPLHLSYEVDTRTGAISKVIVADAPVTGLTTTAFTDAATNYVGVVTGAGSRGALDDLFVSSASDTKSAAPATRPAAPSAGGSK